jgi:hydroxymethylglutaryl-CoA reductase (NADPH)
MSRSFYQFRGYIDDLLKEAPQEDILKRLKKGEPQPAPLIHPGHDAEGVEKRWELLDLIPEEKQALWHEKSRALLDVSTGNIENFVGSIQMPVGIAGPLRVGGLFADGLYHIPLATTEATLVASYSRGARTLTASGGCTAALLSEGVARAPGFIFNDLAEVGSFAVWVSRQEDVFRDLVSRSTRHGRLADMKMTVEGNHVYLCFEYTTGDASGQNMVTFATQTICEYILEKSPVTPQKWYVEANLSGDKKASFQSFNSVRGKKVTAEAVIPAEIARQYLRAAPKELEDYWRISSIGGSLSGTIGMQGHFANGLAALYIACGQDAACVSESAVGITRLEVTGEGDLYASVTLPNLMIGTVGGGTGLPGQNACLKIMGMAGAGKARALAEIAAALCLAGELSIIAALTSGDFSRSHKAFSRKEKA